MVRADDRSSHSRDASLSPARSQTKGTGPSFPKIFLQGFPPEKRCRRGEQPDKNESTGVVVVGGEWM